jgi:Protein of unknown function (DUF3553).
MSDSGDGLLVPGGFVRHPKADDWGLGQIQSVIGTKVTVNFEHRGKVVMDTAQIDLIPTDDDE